MKEKKLVPKRRFREFANDDTWEQCKLSKLLKTQPFKSYLIAPTENGKYPVIQQGFVPVVGYADGVPFTDFENTILFGDHTLSLYKPKKPYFVATDGLKILSSADKMDIDYLYFLIQKNMPLPEGYKRYFSILKEIEVNYAKNLNEQNKIGMIFDNLDNLITLHQRKLKKLKATKSAYLSEMFPKEGEKVPKIRFEGFNSEWQTYKLGDIGSTFNSLSGKSAKDFGHGEAQYITYMNVYKNIIANKNEVEKIEIDNKQTEVKYGDILFTTSSETIEEVGMSSVWLDDTTHTYLNSFCFGYRLNLKVYPHYMAYILRSHLIRKQMITLGQGISRYNISKVKSMEISILIPSIEEQKKIGDFFYNLDKKIEVEKEKLKKLQSMKKAYLNEMFV